MDKTFGGRAGAQNSGNGTEAAPRTALVIIVEDDTTLFNAFHSVGECLSVAVERISTREELGSILRQRRPMAVVAEMDAPGQDGCHVLMTVAAYDPKLPVLLVTGDEPALLGAVDAVEQIWQLSSVTKWPRLLGVGSIVDFLFRAGRKGGCMRLMSI